MHCKESSFFEKQMEEGCRVDDFKFAKQLC